ncbi:YiiX/YebB-like N1pC/P60 family cysteine hydrolase [Thermoproteota archaeon]
MKKLIGSAAITIIASYVLVIFAILIIAGKIFYPNHRLIAIILYLVSWIPFIVEFIRKRKNRQVRKVKKKIFVFIKENKFMIILFALLLLFAYLAWVVIPMERSPLVKLSPEELDELIDADRAKLQELMSRISLTTSKIEESALFTKNAAELKDAEKRYVKGIWKQYVFYIVQLDQLIATHQTFYRLTGEAHDRSFLIAYGAFVTEYARTLEVISTIEGNDFMITFLNEEQGPILKGSYNTLKERVSNHEDILRFNAGAAYMQTVNVSGDLTEEIEKDMEVVYNSKLVTSKALITGPLDTLEKLVFTQWFPIQKEIAETMGETRMTERPYIIDKEYLTSIYDELEPGDILLERREWYMTNLGIPGFWKHSAIFIGTPEEMDSYFKETGKIPSEIMARDHPAIYAKMLTTDEEEYRFTVIESESAGVILLSFQISGNADHLVVLRPVKLTKKEKLESILRAFSHYGKPYDFNFDFTTENEIVCSELVYNAYEDLNLSLELVSGRLLMSPEDIAQKYAAEYGSEDAELELVLFIQSEEENLTYTRQGEQEFLELAQQEQD